MDSCNFQKGWVGLVLKGCVIVTGFSWKPFAVQPEGCELVADPQFNIPMLRLLKLAWPKMKGSESVSAPLIFYFLQLKRWTMAYSFYYISQSFCLIGFTYFYLVGWLNGSGYPSASQAWIQLKVNPCTFQNQLKRKVAFFACTKEPVTMKSQLCFEINFWFVRLVKSHPCSKNFMLTNALTSIKVNFPKIVKSECIMTLLTFRADV